MNMLRSLAVTGVLFLVGCGMQPHRPDASPLANLATPEPGIFVGGRLAATDIAPLEQGGVRQIVDLTLDTETPEFDEASAVRGAGMRYSNLPISGAADLTRENVQRFDALLRASEPPVLVHCASGNRVGALAALRAAWVDDASDEAAIAIGKAWGLTGLEGEVRARIAASRGN